MKMKENKSLEKMKDFGKRKWEDFCSWFAEKEHPKSRLNKNVFFHDLLKIIGLILVFLIIYSNVDKLNKIIPIFINVGSLLELILIFFILRKAWHLVLNLKYAHKGLNHGTKAIIAIVVVILLLFAFLNQDKVVSSITGTYEDANFSKLNPVQISSNFSLFGSDKNSSSGKIIPSTYEDSLVTKCKTSYNSCKSVATQKYDMSISLIKSEKFNDKDSAEEFYNTWKGPLQGELKYALGSYSSNNNIENYLPIVLFASKVSGPGGQLPVVLICNSDGNLISSSKSQLLCG
ncbi:MAG: hypothetical protein M0R03_21500 [Novosphingobium sp.]|nr:hypothetical protein [Novosphingobium sp.]